VLKTAGPGSYYWAAETGSAQQSGTRVNTSRTFFTATANQTAFTGVGTYTPGAGQLRIYIDGVRQFNSAYTETSSTSFTLLEGVVAGTSIMAEVDSFVNYNYTALDIPCTPTGSTSATNVQNALAELDTEKAAVGQQMFLGTTQVAINRTSGALTLTGVSIDGNAATATQATNAATATQAINATLAVDAINTIGYNQTWQLVTRTMGVSYTNSTGKPIMLVAQANRNGTSTSGIQITFGNGVTVPVCYGTNSNGGNTAVGSIIIPAGSTYTLSVQSEALSSYSIWELR
jgi:hypothetical protein